jgi:hypothetical protein
MLRKSMIALCAAAAVVALTPNMALAGHGGGGGGGGHGGGGGGGMGGGGRGASFGGGSFGAGSFSARGAGGGNFVTRGVSSGNFSASFARAAPAFAPGVAAVPSGRFASGQFSHGGFNHGFHHHHGRFFVGGVGYDDYWDYPDYAYDDSYDGNCYVVQQRVHTSHGWRIRPVQVCG